VVIIHHLENSRSQRVAWLLEALDVPYEVKTYARHPKTAAAPEALKQIHPLGKAPVLQDGDRVIAESGAIIDYLCDRYDVQYKLRPTTPDDLIDYRYWLHFAEGSLMPLLVMSLVFAKISTQPMPFFVKPVAKGIASKVKSAFILPRLLPMVDLIEARLTQSPWLVGEDFGAADIQMSFPVQALIRVVNLADYPAIHAYLQRLEQHPAYQKASQRVGAFGPLAS
jgi:glutathione S-transferase